MKKLKAVLFDLDGTLVNSLPLTLKHMKAALDEELESVLLRTIYKSHRSNSIIPDVPLSIILAEFGNGEAIIFDRVTKKVWDEAFPQQDGVPSKNEASASQSDQIKELSANVLKNYLKRHASTISEVPVYEGVPDLLRILKQSELKIGIFTGRSRETTDQLLESQSLSTLFDTIITSSELPRSKPFPDGIYRFRDHFGFPVDEFIFVGDHAYDCDSAIRAGCPFIFQNWQNRQNSKGDHHGQNYQNTQDTQNAQAGQSSQIAKSDQLDTPISNDSILPATEEIQHLCQSNKEWTKRNYLGESKNATELLDLILKYGT